MLALHQLTRTFPHGNQAFLNVNLSVSEGEIVGVLGTSGCGKSTLLRVIAGLDRAEGTVTLDGEPVTGLSRRIGLVYQEPRLMPWLTVRDNVGFGLEALRIAKTEISRIRDRWISRVGLTGSEKLYPKECSGGMAQRVALARTLATSPRLLLLDEPFSALDAFIRMQLQDVLLEIWSEERSTLVLVTHDIDEALYLCDRIVILKGQPGRQTAEITLSQPRPRSRGDAELGRIKNKILEALNLNVPHDPELLYHL